MKIKILVSVAGADFSYSPGEVADMPRKRAEEFIRIGHAEEIKSKITNRKK